MVKTIYFYSRTTEYGEFSNLYLREITYASRKWKSTEHCYQYHKFVDEYKEVAEWLMTAPRPSTLAICAHGFNTYGKYIRKDWQEIKVDLMKELVYAKFSQHEDLKKLLLGTGDANLVEDSPHDNFWGCGKDRDGVNMLGKILMETREKLKIYTKPLPVQDEEPVSVNATTKSPRKIRVKKNS